jgi:hypothetical protein
MTRLLVLAVAAVPFTVPVFASAACAPRTETTPFSLFGDTNPYFPAPYGGFESGSTGWTLAAGAKVGYTNESWKVGGATNTRSAVLPVGTTGTGASATSSLFCVSMSTPTIRLFYRSDNFGPNDWGYLSVEAHYYNDQTGADLGTMYIATINRNDGAWTPTGVLDLVVSGPLNGGNLSSANARVIFTAHGYGAGTFSIDDVYVDPWRCC